MAELEQVLEMAFDNSVAKAVQRTGRRWAPVLEMAILAVICTISFFIRLFAVISYESVIHEFDPYFNFRTTKYLSEQGFYEFWNWFDVGSWYPLGRVIGQTLYPGLMTTSAVLYYILNFLGICINIRNICVFMAPIFAAFTSIAAYLLTKEVTGRPGAGLFAAVFLGVCPSYLSRSVAGSYDNEAVAIFALVNSFYVFVKAINNGSMLWAMFSAVAYFYMVSSWGGYIFILNTIAVYIFGLLVLGKFNERHYVVYSCFYLIGTILCLNIPFVNFQAVTSSEHMASHGMFVIASAYMLSRFIRSVVSAKALMSMVRAFVMAVIVGFVAVFAWLTATGRTRWQGRSMTLLDPTYASKYIPIIASVSEHQPTSWSNYIMDLHILPFLAPIGMYYCFRRSSDASFFLGVYGVLSVYFSGVMIRLLLVLAPATACLAAVGASVIVSAFIPHLRSSTSREGSGGSKSQAVYGGRVPKYVCLLIIAGIAYWCQKFISHCVLMSNMAYSQPSIVMSQQMSDGSRVMQDDFREAYYWLRQNTATDAKILSWWDYGYQITVMGNRTVLVDNNTWNNTHIATVGLVLASKEEDAYPILQKHDVDYVLVLYGGVARYQSDDINKFLWPIRIASGVYPHLVQESEFIGPEGYAVDHRATDRMKNSVMYKLCYYRAAEVTQGVDYARQQQIGAPAVKPRYFDEVFTSENWIVRIYRVKQPANLGTNKKMKSRSAYAFKGESKYK